MKNLYPQLGKYIATKIFHNAGLPNMNITICEIPGPKNSPYDGPCLIFSVGYSMHISKMNPRDILNKVRYDTVEIIKEITSNRLLDGKVGIGGSFAQAYDGEDHPRIYIINIRVDRLPTDISDYNVQSIVGSATDESSEIEGIRLLI